MIREPKKKILVSFSGGETSGYMLKHILENYSQDHEIKILFANTGEENEETLLFVKRCQEHFKCDIVWLEYERLSFKVVNFDTAYRSHDPEQIEKKWPDHPFRKYISHYGIPNRKNPTCTRELKERTMKRYLSSIGWKPSDFTLSIGIRSDEIDRVGDHWYPLVFKGITKVHVNSFWDSMPFRLELKGYEGNCKTCWKKSFRKLATIARYNPHHFGFMRQMEVEFSEFVKKERMKNAPNRKISFFRENKFVSDIFEMASDPSIKDAEDDSRLINYQMNMWNDLNLDSTNGCEESCEAF